MQGIAVLAALSLVAAADAPPKDDHRFNLSCQGDVITLALGRPTETRRWSNVYVVDGRAKKWCGGDCKVASKLLNLSADSLTFFNDPKPNGHDTAAVDLNTGEYQGVLEVDDAAGKVFILVRTTGVCTRAPFTGLPRR